MIEATQQAREGRAALRQAQLAPAPDDTDLGHSTLESAREHVWRGSARRDTEEQLVVLAAGERQLERIESAPRAERSQPARQRQTLDIDDGTDTARAQHVTQILDEPVGDVDGGADE